MPLGFEATDNHTIQVIIMPHAADLPLCFELEADLLIAQIALLEKGTPNQVIADWSERVGVEDRAKRAWILDAMQHLQGNRIAQQRILEKARAVAHKRPCAPLWVQTSPRFVPLRTELPPLIEATQKIVLQPFGHPKVLEADSTFLHCMGALAGIYYEVLALANGYHVRLEAPKPDQPDQPFSMSTAPEGLTLEGPISAIASVSAQLTMAYLETYPGAGMILAPPKDLVEDLKEALAKRAQHIPGGLIAIAVEGGQQWVLTMPGKKPQWHLSENSIHIDARAKYKNSVGDGG